LIHQINQYKERDNSKRLNLFAAFAQNVWKKKKGINALDKNLHKMKAEQEIFARSSGKIEQVPLSHRQRWEA
jgi:hypothetical protein